MTFIMVLLAGCTSPEKKAQSCIKAEMKKNLNDPSSYEPVEFSKLDSLFSYFRNSQEWSDIRDSVDKYEHIYEDHISSYSWVKERAQEKMKDLGLSFDEVKGKTFYFLEKQDSLEKNYKPEWIGWEMKHKFRAKNGFGAMKLDEEIFHFDKEVTKIYPYSELLIKYNVRNVRENF